MKISVNRCPNCGAQLDIDENSKLVKCNYCRSKILLREETNTPGLESYQILALKAFQNKDYYKALTYYEKALELDAGNSVLDFKCKLCKAKKNNYIDYSLTSFQKALKDALDVADGDDSIFWDTFEMIRDFHTSTISYYNRNYVTLNELTDIISRLLECILIMDTLLEKIVDEDIKTELLAEKYSLIENTLANKEYATQRMPLRLKACNLNQVIKEKLQKEKEIITNDKGKDILSKYNMEVRQSLV